MRTKLATLEVWLDDQPLNSVSRFNPTTKHAEIVVSTKGAPGNSPVQSDDEVKDVLAHELGHFLGYAMGVKEQYQAASNEIQMMRWLTGANPPVTITAETQAWDWAEKMRSINPAIRDKYLGSYTRNE